MTEEQIRGSLSDVLVPGVGRSLVMMNLVREVTVSGQRVNITLAAAALNAEIQDLIRAKTKTVVEKLSGVKTVAVEFTEVKPAELNQFSQIIAVMSGKGGVGKSLVSGLIAVGLRPSLLYFQAGVR